MHEWTDARPAYVAEGSYHALCLRSVGVASVRPRGGGAAAAGVDEVGSTLEAGGRAQARPASGGRHTLPPRHSALFETRFCIQPATDAGFSAVRDSRLHRSTNMLCRAAQAQPRHQRQQPLRTRLSPPRRFRPWRQAQSVLHVPLQQRPRQLLPASRLRPLRLRQPLQDRCEAAIGSP